MVSVESSELDIYSWVDSETTQLDVIASWDSLNDTYQVLSFTDQISDQARIEEYKWIIKEMNKHLTRAKKKLLSCQDLDAMEEVLQLMYQDGEATLNSRQSVAYRKLKQRWVSQMLWQIQLKKIALEGKENQDG